MSKMVYGSEWIKYYSRQIRLISSTSVMEKYGKGSPKWNIELGRYNYFY